MKAKHFYWNVWLFPTLLLTVLLLAFAIPAYINSTDTSGNDIEMRLQGAGFTVLHATVYWKESVSIPGFLNFVLTARQHEVYTIYRWGHDFCFVYGDTAYYLVP